MMELVQLTDAEILEVDRRMNDHMHGHAISNNVGSWTCNDYCRQQALSMAINDVLKKKFEDAQSQM